MLGCFLHLQAAAQAAPPRSSDEITHTEQEIALELRLIAPCCWSQTLDNHESPIARELRAEIRTRLARGETQTQIEDDLAHRYGERIRAVPRGRDPFAKLPYVLLVAMLLSAYAIYRIGRATRRRAAPTAPPEATLSDEDEERLANELDRLDSGLP